MARQSIRNSLALALTTALAVAAGCDTTPADFDGDSDGAGPTCSLDEGEEMYDRYIAPLMEDANAQSCMNCHNPEDMSLNTWEMDNACSTMACMVEKELINLENPEDSRVLEFIDFGRPETGFDIQVEREHDGFVAWIQYGVACHLDACGEMNDPCETGSTSTNGGPGSGGAGAGGSGGGTGTGGSGGTSGGSGGIYGNCQQADMQAQFDTLVFPLIDGCKSCHEEPGDPEFDNAKRWYHANDSALTLVDMVGHSGMFNTVQLEKSELITKPLHTGQVFSSVINATFVGEEHEGGQKLTPAGPNFQSRFDSMVTFIQYFATCHQ